MGTQRSQMQVRGRQELQSLDPPFAATREDWVFAAGVWQGEGTCGCYRHERSRPKHWLGLARLMCTVTQKEEWLLDWFIARFGGGKSHARSKNGAWGHWRIYGQRAFGFLYTIYPLLSPQRQARVRAALSGWEMRHVSHRAA